MQLCVMVIFTRLISLPLLFSRLLPVDLTLQIPGTPQEQNLTAAGIEVKNGCFGLFAIGRLVIKRFHLLQLGWNASSPAEAACRDDYGVTNFLILD